MTRLRIAPEAEEELAQAAEWYESRRPGLGVELVAVVDNAIEQILALPLTSPLWRVDRPYRRKTLRRFPYAIIFRAEDGLVIVDAIAHTRRAPTYWAERARGANR